MLTCEFDAADGGRCSLGMPNAFAVEMSAVVEAVENGSSPKASEKGSMPSKFEEAIVVDELFFALFF